MKDEGKLIYRRRTGWLIWLWFIIPPIAAMGAAIDDGSWEMGIVPSAISFVAIVVVLWFAIGWSGRTRVAEVRLQDDILLMRRSHIFDRGKVLHIPLSETRNWSAVLEHYGSRRLEVAQFDHGETTYTLQIAGAEYVDLDKLNAWVQRDFRQP
ncbi:MAG: hypothetical protein ABS76_13120 [Pelagibacterium sp. SCN 64-44]|nr:MAG: hypothetical protein ABS76_13120 [Pelagibacterium sp. SCN 64-44]